MQFRFYLPGLDKHHMRCEPAQGLLPDGVFRHSVHEEAGYDPSPKYAPFHEHRPPCRCDHSIASSPIVIPSSNAQVI